MIKIKKSKCSGQFEAILALIVTLCLVMFFYFDIKMEKAQINATKFHNHLTNQVINQNKPMAENKIQLPKQEDNKQQIQPQIAQQTPKVPIEDQYQTNFQPKSTQQHTNSGIKMVKFHQTYQPGLIQDWGARKTTIGNTNYINSNPFPQTIGPSNPTSPSSNSDNLNPRPIDPSATVRGKAGISAQQAVASKKYLQLKNMPDECQLADEQRKYYQQKYKLSTYPQLPFCIVVPSYKNVAGDRYIYNMKSILQQEYDNYRIIFIDDASQDETGRKVTQWITQQRISQQKIQIIINKQRGMAMPNLHKAANQFCKPYQIYMIVDGDDELVGRQVFKHFNQIFSQSNVWVAYTNFISVRGSIGYSRPYSQATMDKNGYRRSAFVISHLRAFYTKLFQSIKQEDLRDQQGNWFRAANDVAMYLPILEMAHQRVKYVPQISYMYNSNTGLNNHRVKLKQQKGNQRKIKSKSPYQALDTLFTDQEINQLKQHTGIKIPKIGQRTPINFQNKEQNQQYLQIN